MIGSRIHTPVFTMCGNTVLAISLRKANPRERQRFAQNTWKPDHISQKDWDDLDDPEWTEEQFARAVPFKEAFAAAYDSWKRGRGRPKVEPPKVKINFRFAAETVQALQASGRGYNARVEKL